MKLKNRILVIITVATAIFALLTGEMAVALIRLYAPDAPWMGIGPVIFWIIVATFLISGLLILGLLDMLLMRYVDFYTLKRNLLEKERELLTEQLRRSQEIGAIGHMAGSIAHDFNNMLTIIDGYASLIVAEPTSKETKENAQQVVKATRQALSMTRKLLGLEQREHANQMVIDLNTALLDAEKILIQLLDEKVQLETKIFQEPLPVAINPARLTQVLINLSNNANAAMLQGGKIVIEASRLDLDDEKTFPAGIPSSRAFAKISVQDSGAGISPEWLDQIFEPFFSTRKDAAGLGLAVVERIISKAGGVVDLESEPGKGTVFRVYLPLLDPKEESLKKEKEALSPKEKALTSPQKKKEQFTILLAEDDDLIRSLLLETLEPQHYRILLAEDGCEAEQIAREYKGQIDLLFTDVAMDTMDGTELAQIVRSLYPEIKILFMSGYANPKNKLFPDAEFLQKPFMPDALISTLKRLLKNK
jgi:two-component system cell cycle sensor histidine kinase/response regulator CckA